MWADACQQVAADETAGESNGNRTLEPEPKTMIFDAILEEAAGTLCGLPPGTIMAAKAMGVGLATASASAEEASVTEQKTSGLSEEEEIIVKTAVHNLAVTAKRDNPTWSDRKAAKFGMGLLLVVNKLYSGDDLKNALLDATSASRRRHHNLIRNVGRAIQ